jgi:hypothetical protein
LKRWKTKSVKKIRAPDEGCPEKFGKKVKPIFKR